MQETRRAFVFDVCGAEANWNMADFIEDQVEQVRAQVGDKKVLDVYKRQGHRPRVARQDGRRADADETGHPLL